MKLQYWISFIYIICVGGFLTYLSLRGELQNPQKSDWKIVAIILLVVIAGGAEYNKTRLENIASERSHTEILDAINSTSNQIGVKDFPGWQVVVTAKLEDAQADRRKYIFDIGNRPDKERVSLYLDSDNNLVYRIIDKQGEPHSYTVPQLMHTFQLGTWYFFRCEYGESTRFNYMRISINDKRYPPIVFENKIDLPKKINNKNLLMFTDMEKTSFAKATISHFSTIRGSGTDAMADSYMQIWSEYWSNIGN